MNLSDYTNQIVCDDCWNIIPNLPDKSVFLCTDPPYGQGVAADGKMSSGKGKAKAPAKQYKPVDWDADCLSKEQVDELLRVSYAQVIFGGNFIADKLPPSRCWVVWDKRVGKSLDIADCELIYTSFDKPARMIRYRWQGFVQGTGGKKEIRYHPTQKPVYVVEQLLNMFAKKEFMVFDPFGGSGTTALACQNLGLNYFLIEREKYYFDISVKRIEENVIQEKFSRSLESGAELI